MRSGVREPKLNFLCRFSNFFANEITSFRRFSPVHFNAEGLEALQRQEPKPFRGDLTVNPNKKPNAEAT